MIRLLVVSLIIIFSVSEVSSDEFACKSCLEQITCPRESQKISIDVTKWPTVKSTFPRFKVVCELKISNDESIFHGAYGEWFADGQLESLGVAIYGIEHGESLSWYEDKRLRQVTNYYFGEKNGLEYYFYKNGVVAAEITYDNGKTIKSIYRDINSREVKYDRSMYKTLTEIGCYKDYDCISDIMQHLE